MYQHFPALKIILTTSHDLFQPSNCLDTNGDVGNITKTSVSGGSYYKPLRPQKQGTISFSQLLSTISYGRLPLDSSQLRFLPGRCSFWMSLEILWIRHDVFWPFATRVQSLTRIAKSNLFCFDRLLSHH